MKLRRFRLAHNQSGQAQILAAVTIGLAMLTAALYTLEYSRSKSDRQTVTSIRSEMRASLILAVEKVANIYRSDAGCDPAILNELLSRTNTDGTINTRGVPFTQRALTVTYRGFPYQVQLGPVGRVPGPDGITPWTPPGFPAGDRQNIRGVTEDATIEVWTTRQLGIAGVNRQQSRIIQRAVLINNCNYACAEAYTPATFPVLGQCTSALPVEASYHRITNPDAFPAAGDSYFQNCAATGDPTGALDLAQCNVAANADDIGPEDLEVLRNYLRSGDPRGSCDQVLGGVPGGGGLASCTDAAGAGCGVAAAAGCADLNQDQLVNEMDLNILEKTLRGYLHGQPR